MQISGYPYNCGVLNIYGNSNKIVKKSFSFYGDNFL